MKENFRKGGGFVCGNMQLLCRRIFVMEIRNTKAVRFVVSKTINSVNFQPKTAGPVFSNLRQRPSRIQK